jgi:hypothetical protein
MEWPDLLLLASIACFSGALVFGEPAYNMYKAWKLKRAFKLREKADRRRTKKADRT